MYKVSFAIPIYNVSSFIEKTLLSALNQTYENIEYLLIDDKGQDDSMRIVNKIVANHPRNKDINIIEHPHNIGLGSTRNTAIQNAQGKYLFFMDSDDEIIPECIEILINKIELYNVDFVASSHIKRDLNGNLYNVDTYNDTLIKGNEYPVANYRYSKNKNIYIMCWNKLYNLDFLKINNIHCKPGHLNEDCWFTYQVIINAKSCFLSSIKTLYYTINPESITSKTATQGYSIRQSINYAETEREKSLYIKSLTNKDIYSTLLVDIMFMSIYHSYRILLSKNEKEKKERERIVKTLLKRNFLLPSKIKFNISFLYFSLLYLFYCAPMKAKIVIIKYCIKLDLQKILKKWIHFD